MNTDSHGSRPLFLFGSYTSPMPKINEITYNILNGDLKFHTDGRLYKEARNTNIDDARNPELCKATLKTIIRLVARNEKHTSSLTGDLNYEEIAEILSKLTKNEGTQRDKALDHFRTLVFNELSQALASKKQFKEIHDALQLNQISFGDILLATDAWIQWNIFEALVNRNSTYTNGLMREPDGKKRVEAQKSFFEAISVEGKAFTLCTLNHDTYSETILDDLSIEYNDGFEWNECQQSARFHPKHFRVPNISTLLKLHGSINWLWNGSEYQRSNNPDYDYNERNCSSTPNFLAGTFAKMEAYSYGIYPWIWAEFQNQLLHARRIICSGYGFKDLGVTSRLSNWLNTFPDAKLLIIAPFNDTGEKDGLIEACQKDRIDVITSFFKKTGEFGNGHEYTVCTTSDEVRSASTPVIVLNEKFEDACKHTEVFRWFAYDWT